MSYLDMKRNNALSLLEAQRMIGDLLKNTKNKDIKK